MKKAILALSTFLCLTIHVTTFAQDAPDLTVILTDHFDNTIDFQILTSLTDINGNYVFDLVVADIDFGDGTAAPYSADANESVFVNHTYLPGAFYSAVITAVFSDTIITTTFPVEIGVCAPGNQPVTMGLHEEQYIGAGTIDVFYPREDNTTWSFILDNTDPLTTTRSFCLAQEDCSSVHLEGSLGAYANVYCIGAEEFPLLPDPMFPYVQLCPEILCLSDITEVSSGIGYVELSVNQTSCPSVNWYINGEMQTGHGFVETLYFPTDGFYSIMVNDTCGDCNQAVSTFYQVEGGNVFLVFSSTEDEQLEPILNIYPNPVMDILNIQSSDAITVLEVMDQTGRLILRESNNYQQSHTIDFSSFARGIYVVGITDQHGKHYVRQVIK